MRRGSSLPLACVFLCAADLGSVDKLNSGAHASAGLVRGGCVKQGEGAHPRTLWRV